MSMTFEGAMVLTRTVSSNAAFEDNECEAYFNILMSLPEDALIVEVGLEYGRSSSIALQVAKEKRLRYVGIDPVIQNEWYDMLIQAGDPSTVSELHNLSSDGVHWFREIDAILIDGDHSYGGVRDDCEHFLPYVKERGYAMFHDFERESLPNVTRAVGQHMRRHGEFAFMFTVGTLGIWRRL
jgi:hypothetical protein